MESPLPPMPAWQARSFWIALVGAALQIATLADFDLLAVFGVENADQLTDSIMQVVAAVALIWAWFERKAPMRQLSLSGQSTAPTFRSPAWVGAAALALLALAACAELEDRTGYTQKEQVCIANATLAAWKSLPADTPIARKLPMVTSIVADTCDLNSTPVLAQEVQEAAPVAE